MTNKVVYTSKIK